MCGNVFVHFLLLNWGFIPVVPIPLVSVSKSHEISWKLFLQSPIGVLYCRKKFVIQNCRIVGSSQGVCGRKWVYLSQFFHETHVLFKLTMAHRYAFLQKILLTLWYYKKSVDHWILQDSFCGFWWIRVFSSNFLSLLW